MKLHYPGTCWEGLRKSMKMIIKDSRFPGRGWKVSDPENYVAVATMRCRNAALK
jgi:hypothetical protein